MSIGISKKFILVLTLASFSSNSFAIFKSGCEYVRNNARKFAAGVALTLGAGALYYFKPEVVDSTLEKAAHTLEKATQTIEQNPKAAFATGVVGTAGITSGLTWWFGARPLKKETERLNKKFEHLNKEFEHLNKELDDMKTSTDFVHSEIINNLKLNNLQGKNLLTAINNHMGEWTHEQVPSQALRDAFKPFGTDDLK